MKKKLIFHCFFFCLVFLPIRAFSQPAVHGLLYPEEFGALGDGTHDDTRAIQQAIDQLVKIGGGTVKLGSGTYLVKTIKLGPKVSIVGNGNGATVIKQAKGVNEHCLIVRDIAAALKIADLTVLGEDSNRGIFFEASGGAGENQHYLYSNTEQWDKSQAYKWVTIENVCVYRFETGLFIREYGFNINICNSTFSYNGNGVILSCSDSFIYNCYVANNSKNGLVVNGGSNKINNIKSIFNGRSNAEGYGAIVIKGPRNQITNCETQDNFGKGFIIEGRYNLISNCMSNTDGYSRTPYQYDPKVEACGFMIKELYNTFVNCAVMYYNEKYGAVYHSPVMVDSSVSYYYPDIFDNIKVIIAPDKLMFNEPFQNVQTLASKNKVKNRNIGIMEGGQYFLHNHNKNNQIKIEEIFTGSLQLVVDFRSSAKYGNIIEIDGNRSLCAYLEHSSVNLSYEDNLIAELALDEDAVLNKDDLRLVVSFNQYEDKKYIEMQMFEKTIGRGWVKKEMRKETTIPFLWLNKATVRIGDENVPVKRLVVTQSPLPESVLLPSSNTNKIYDSAIVYVDADSYE